MSVNVVMLGPPGAGKGTQAEVLAQACGVPRVSTGDILREAVQGGTELGRQARAVMEAGQLVGDDIVIGIVRERLARPDAAGGFVLDGFPRTPAQAEALERMLAGRGGLVVVQLDVPAEVLVQRLSGRRVCSACGTTAGPDAPGGRCAACGGPLVQRPDDGEAVVRERLQVYERRTRPLIDYYRERPGLVAVDGNRPAGIVSEAGRAVVTAAAAACPGLG
jgi:adenylate kinase